MFTASAANDAQPATADDEQSEQTDDGQIEQATALEVTPAQQRPARQASTYSKDFLEWWEHYPRKASKGDAHKAWKAIPARDRDLAALTAAADRYTQDPNRSEQYTKLPGTWLRARCWEDEAPLPARYDPRQQQGPATGDRRVMAAQALKQQTGEPQWTGMQSLTY